MPQTVTMPVFGNANNQTAQASEPGNENEWQMDTEGDADFDLLAEYLLEENPTTTSNLNFDFQVGSANNSTVVSPEQSVDEGLYPNNRMVSIPQSIPNQNGINRAPAPLAPTPSLAISASAPPMVAAQGINMPATNGSYIQATTHIAPAPSLHTGLNTGMPQTNAASAKRQRLDESGSKAAAVQQVMSDPNAVVTALQGRGRKKTQAQIDRRRERNRILARRTRLRKKFFFESLQKEVVDLQRENAALKDIVRSELSSDGDKILSECDALERMPHAVLEACGENANEYDQQDFNLVRSIQQSQHSFIITDPSLEDNPIVFVSDDFLNLTGYSREDVLGRNCRFLQGTDTSQEKVDTIRKGLANGEDVSVTILNYTAEGTPFWNKLFIAALRDAQNNIVNYIGVTVKIKGPEEGDSEFGKHVPGASAADADTADDLDELNDFAATLDASDDP